MTPSVVNSFTESGLRALRVNADYDRGQLVARGGPYGCGSARRCGALITLVDVPLVSAGTVRSARLLSTHPRADREANLRYSSRPSLLIDRSLFDALRAGDLIRRQTIVRAHASAPAISISPTRALLWTLIPMRSTGRLRTAVVVGRTSTRTIASGVARVLHCRELIVPGAPAHFGVGVTFRDQPGADARRDFSDHSRMQHVEPHAIELILPRRSLDTDFHLETNFAKSAPYEMESNT